MTARDADRLPALRWALLASVVLPLIGALILMGALGWLVGRQALNRLSVRIQEEVGHRVTADLEPWLDAPHAIDAANADLMQAGLLPADDDLLRDQFLRQLGHQPAVSYVQVGWAADGGFVGVERNEDGTFDLEVTDHPRTGKAVYRLDPAGPVPLSVVDGYDARTRPWYQAAIAADGPAWSPIYQFSSQQSVRFGVTAVQPVRDADGALVGVVGADLVLTHLSELLRDAVPSPGARLMLLDREGLLVASSVDPVYRLDDGRASRIAANETADPLSRAAVMALDQTLTAPSSTRLQAPQDAFVYATPLADGRGLDWLLVVVIPTADLTGGLDQLGWWVGVMMLGVLVLAVGVGAMVTRRLVEPVAVLSRAAEALANGDRQAPLPVANTREIASLADAFATMRDRMAASLDEARRAQRSAEVANRAKSTFLANMSHELRTPLNAVVGYTELMLEGLLDGLQPEALRGDLEHVRSSARHLLGLINDLLDLARIESGRAELRIESVDVGPLLIEVASALRPEVERRRNRFEVDVQGIVESASVDPTRLRQVVINLVGNAAKFTEGGVVELSARAEPRGVIIRVRDTGIGIDDAHLVSIFQPFMRLDTTDGREGAGLGLAIVARLVTEMGGLVSVKSTLGRGTEFTLVLPRVSDG